MGLEKDNLENEVVWPVDDVESDDVENNDLENDILVNNNPEMDLFLGSIATVRENYKLYIINYIISTAYKALDKLECD